MKQFRSTFYLPAHRNRLNHTYEENENGYLYAKGLYLTKIRPEDLPSWYVYGYLYGQHGYISAKGVKHLVYRPNYLTNHMHKDDILYISYHEPIEPEEKSKSGIWYTGYEHTVYGHLILDFLNAAAEHSEYEIEPIMAEVRKKEQWYHSINSQ